MAQHQHIRLDCTVLETNLNPRISLTFVNLLVFKTLKKAKCQVCARDQGCDLKNFNSVNSKWPPIGHFLLCPEKYQLNQIQIGRLSANTDFNIHISGKLC